MAFFVDVSVRSLNKHNEELCGDKVEVIRTRESVIIILSDGLGIYNDCVSLNCCFFP